MTRVGPGTTLKLKALITYVLGGRETTQEFETNALTFGSDALPEPVWQALVGKRAGEEANFAPEEPFSMGGFVEHEIFEVPRSSFRDEPRPGDPVQVPQDDGSNATMTVVKVETERVLVSPNPLALNPVKRARVMISSITGGIVIDGDQIDPDANIRVHSLALGDAVRLTQVGRGLLGCTGGVVVNDGTDGGPSRGLWVWHPDDSNHVIYSASPAGKSPADRQCTAGNFDGGHRFRLRTYADGQGFLFENSDEQALVDIDSRNGRLWAKGGVYSGNSDVYFTKTDHNHTGIGNAAGHAAIENGADYGALMILGRAVSTDPLRRVVKVWDELTVEGDFAARRMLNPSDARDKDEVVDLDPGLAELERLRPVSFAWKGAQPGTRTYGLLAQEVREVLGDVVEQDKDADRLKVSYVELIPVLINAVKQLSAKVATLEAELAAR